MIQEVRITTVEDLMPLLSEQEYRPEIRRNRSGRISSFYGKMRFSLSFGLAFFVFLLYNKH